MIVDVNNNFVSNLEMRIAPGDTKEFSLPVVCQAGFTLKAESVSLVTIEAKAAPGDAYFDLTITPVDLSPFAGQTKTFYFRVSVDEIAPEQIENIFLIVE